MELKEITTDILIIGAGPAGLSAALYAAPAYLEQHGTPQIPQDLARHARLCVLEHESQEWLLQSGEQKQGIGGPVAAIINSPEMLTRLAASGLGIVASNRLFAMPFEEKGELVRVLPDWHLPLITIWAVYPERRLLPGKTRAFLDLLEAWLRPDS